jgi:hypothetical protein
MPPGFLVTIQYIAPQKKSVLQMKTPFKILRWVFGLLLIVASIGGFGNGDIGFAFVTLFLGILLLPPMGKILFKSKKERLDNTGAALTVKTTQKPVVFQSKVQHFPFPDRNETIAFHVNALQRGFKTGDLDFVNLSYAKLIEAVRQQNINEKGKHDALLEDTWKEYDDFRKAYGLSYPPQFLPPSKGKMKTPPSKPRIPAGIIINPESNFPLTVYNAPENILQQVTHIFADEKIGNKEKFLMPLFAENDIKCREITSYIDKYKPIYLAKMEALKQQSTAYAAASAMDKEDMEREFVAAAAGSLYENAFCDLELLFQEPEIQTSDYQGFIQEFGYENIHRYARWTKDLTKVHIDQDRKEFEDLIVVGLAIPGEQISLEEILKVHSLKTLNAIAGKEPDFFKRKEKAIECILTVANPRESIGQHIAMRRIFKLNPLPTKYGHLELTKLSRHWQSVKTHVELIVDTWRTAAVKTDWLQGDRFYGSTSIRLEKPEDWSPEAKCPRATEACRKRYTPSKLPKLPLHLGCKCTWRMED